VWRAEFASVITLSFPKIDGIISDNLPFGALRDKNWWSNSKHTAQAQAWLGAGWRVQDVNLEEGNVTFKKALEKGVEKRRRRKTLSRAVKKPFNVAPVKPKPFRKPSKTKIARVQARLKNIERRRLHTQRYSGKLKSPPAHEKRLFKLDVKPSEADV